MYSQASDRRPAMQAQGRREMGVKPSQALRAQPATHCTPVSFVANCHCCCQLQKEVQPRVIGPEGILMAKVDERRLRAMLVPEDRGHSVQYHACLHVFAETAQSSIFLDGSPCH